MKRIHHFIVVIIISGLLVTTIMFGGSSARSGRAAQEGPAQCLARYNGAIVNDLQTAIDNAADSTTVAVSGTCEGTFDIVLKNLVLEGGWNNDFSVKNPALYPTTLDAAGDLSGPVLTVSGYIVVLRDLIIKNGDHEGNGGGLYNSAEIFIYDTQFISNWSNFGGAIYNVGSLTVVDSTFTSNRAGENGAGIYNTGATSYLEIDNGTFTSNNASDKGGGVFNENTEYLVIISNSAFSYNQAGDGGAIYNQDSETPNIGNTVFNNNSATYGGAIYNFGQGAVFINQSEIEGNTASLYGGGIFNEGLVVELTDVNLKGNVTTIGDGGGLSSLSGSITVTLTTISQNSSKGYGGAVHVENGSLYVDRSTISANSAIGGGGVYNDYADVTIYRSTLTGNSATNGGGVSNNEGITLISNSTLSGNTATGKGGGVNNASIGETTLYFSTLSGNAGGGVYNEGTLILKSAIIANSTGADGDCKNNGGTVNGSYSLIEDTGAKACGLANGVNQLIIGQDPRLGPLAPNGGPTATHALLNASPAIDYGDTSICPGVDQRGVSRPQGTTFIKNCDIGAYERAPGDKPYRIYTPILVQGSK